MSLCEKGICTHTFIDHSYPVSAVAIQGNLIVSGSWDKTVKVWEYNENEWKCVETLEGHSSSVTAVAISADGKRIVSGSEDNTAKVWDLNI